MDESGAAGEEVAQAYRRLLERMPVDVREAHEHCKRNRTELLGGSVCGCFHCCEVFTPDRIREWLEPGVGISEDGVTALCPHCEIDAVIGERSGFPITAEFLRTMREYWF